MRTAEIPALLQQSTMDRATKIMLYKLQQQEANTESLAMWAVDMLEAGYTSDHLGMLAALALECAPDLQEIKHLFAFVLEELGWTIPTEEELTRE